MSTFNIGSPPDLSMQVQFITDMSVAFATFEFELEPQGGTSESSSPEVPTEGQLWPRGNQ